MPIPISAMITIDRTVSTVSPSVWIVTSVIAKKASRKIKTITSSAVRIVGLPPELGADGGAERTDARLLLGNVLVGVVAGADQWASGDV